MRPAVASLGDRSDFLCVARADAVGKCALRERVAGDYCNRGQDRNSNLAHNASHLAKGLNLNKDYTDLPKTQDSQGCGHNESAKPLNAESAPMSDGQRSESASTYLANGSHPKPCSDWRADSSPKRDPMVEPWLHSRREPTSVLRHHQSALSSSAPCCPSSGYESIIAVAPMRRFGGRILPCLFEAGHTSRDPLPDLHAQD